MAEKTEELIDLNNPDHKQALQNVMFDILEPLRGFEDNRVVINDMAEPNYPQSVSSSMFDMMSRLYCLRYLESLELIQFPDTVNGDHYVIDILNRYKFEALHMEIIGFGGSVKEDLGNIIYYDPKSGEGYVNGERIKLKDTKKSNHKKLFNLLFANANEEVGRTKLVLAIGRHKVDDKLDINTAFSNLRSACKTNKTVISLSNGNGILRGQTFSYKNPSYKV